MEHISNYKTNETAWFELYTSFYRSTEVIKLLEKNDVDYFFPMHTEIIVYKGIEIRKRVPSMPGRIFVRTTGSRLKEFLKDSVLTGIKTVNKDGEIEPLTISDYRMQQITELYSNNGEELSFEEIVRLLD